MQIAELNLPKLRIPNSELFWRTYASKDKSAYCEAGVGRS